jgi:hypothetical protein
MRSGSTSTRRATSILLAAALLCGAAGLRAQPQGGAPAAGGQAAGGKDQFLFDTDAGIIVFQVKPDKAADFESAWTEIKTKLSGSDKPDLKAQGESMKIYKIAAPPSPTDPVGFILQVDPPSKASYDPGKIMFSPGSPWERKDADVTYKKIVDGIASISIMPLAKVAK